MSYKLISFCILLCHISSSHGQSYFFNTQQYGLKSTLLGGAVTAGSDDLSMIYYNPAALRYAQDKSLDLALLMPNYRVYDYNGYFGTDQNITSRDFNLNPTLITYSTDIGKQNVVFTLLQKDSWNNNFNYSEEVNTNSGILSESFSYRYSGDETWLGLGTSFNLAEGLSLGLSHFWSLLGTDYRYSIQSEALVNATTAQDDFFSQTFDASYSSTLSMVTKVGLAFDRGSDRFGLVLTTPRHSPIEVGASLESSTIDISDGQFALGNQTDFGLAPSVRYGWEVSIGYARLLQDSTQLWANLTHVTGVSPYDLLTIGNASQQSLIFEGGTESVTNLSIGMSKKLNNRLEFLTSFRTNFTAYRNGSQDPTKQKLHVIDNDRLHLAAGCKIDGRNSSIVVGLDWGFSYGESQQLFDGFPNIDILKTQDAQYKYNSVTLLLTYEFILDSVQKNVSKLFDRNEE